MKLNLTEEIKENIRVRAKAHINSTDPSTFKRLAL